MGFYSGYRCDKCGASDTYENANTKWLLTSFARDNGWTIGKKVLCPNCKRGKKKVN